MKKRLIDSENTAMLTLTNFGGLVIKIDDSGDSLEYQFDYGIDNLSDIEEAQIEYFEDTENQTGYAEEEDGLWQAGFKVNDQIYFLGEFMRTNYNS